MFDRRVLLDRGLLSPAERRLSALVGARVDWPPDVMAWPVWPSLRWPDRVHEVDIREYCPREQLDEAAQRRADQAALLELGAWDLHRARLAEREVRRAAARRARSLAAFARARPAAALDRAPGEVGAASEASRAARPAALTEVSEWAADEAAVALGMSPTGATRLLAQCVTLDEQLPATWAALEAGDIGWEHARVLVEVLGPMTTDAKRREAEERLLARVGGKSPAQLRAAARRVVLRIDAEAAVRRAAAAVAGRSVRAFPLGDGMGGLEARMPMPVMRACYTALSAHAEACRVPGDERSKDELMADCLADLLLRPGATDRAPVQVSLTVVAPAASLLGGDEPGEIDGEVVPAAVVRELAYTLGLLPRPRNDAADDAGADPSAADVAALGVLLGTSRVAGTALEHRPRVAVVDELDGTLLALTDAAGLRRGEALGPPPESRGYRPRQALDRFVRLRDRRCRFPGCRARPRRCDLDHVDAHPHGPTAACNLCALCEHHHRLKHQAPGWTLTSIEGGGLTWTTPGGLQVTTRPPRHGTDDDVPPGADPPSGGRTAGRRRDDAARPGRGSPGTSRDRAATAAARRLPGSLELLRSATGRSHESAPPGTSTDEAAAAPF